MSNEASVRFDNGGLLAGLLTIALVVLKLTGVIDWSWWWVLSPLWISVLVAVAFVVVVVVVAAFATRKVRR